MFGGCILQMRNMRKRRVDTMKRLFFSMLTVVALVAGCAAQSAPAPQGATQQGATPDQDPTVQAPSTPAPSTPAPSTPAPSTQVPATQAPSAPAPTTQGQSTSQIPAGTVIAAELSKSLDAKKAKAGDKVEAKTAVDLLSQGKIVIPRNTKIIGHVTDAKAHSKESPDSMVGIAFDRISMKDGHDVPIQAAVQAIGRPLQSAALSNSTGVDNTGMPSAGAPSTAGGGMGGTTPSRSSERVASYPPASGSGTDPSSPGSGTLAPLGPTSQGAVGMKGISLKPSDQGTVITSEKDNVHLDSGTQLILRTQ